MTHSCQRCIHLKNPSAPNGFLISWSDYIATKEKSMNSFYNSLIAGEDETLIFDITSLSSASRNIDWLEWGYIVQHIKIETNNPHALALLHGK